MRKTTAIILITLFVATMIAICYKASQPRQEVVSPELQEIHIDTAAVLREYNLKLFTQMIEGVNRSINRGYGYIDSGKRDSAFMMQGRVEVYEELEHQFGK